MSKDIETIYNLVCKHFPNDDNFQRFYREFYEMYGERTKYECEIHSCSGQSPDGRCQLCVYDEIKTKS